MKRYLFDTNFLKKLDYSKNKKVYSRITLLSLNDEPKEYIEGVVSGGSINVDGASAVRRSCSLNLAIPQDHPIITDEYWCYNNKFKLEIGLDNNIDKQYPEIVWFEQGVFVINSFSKSTNTNTISVSISGKDKMCRLNGEISGNIPVETDFGTIQEIDDKGNTLIRKIPLRTIIQQAVKWYGEEPANNIIINDLDDYGLELWDYRGDTPMYIIIEVKGSIKYPRTIVLDMGTKIKFQEMDMLISQLEEKGGKYYSLNTFDPEYNSNASIVRFGSIDCYVAKIEYGETAGYHLTPLVYNGDLILKAGETVSSLLDKLKNMLGNFEYFYNLSGQFVFQKKRNYTHEIFDPFDKENNSYVATAESTLYSYRFEDHELFTAISNPPNITNTKNDFSVWGRRKGVSGAELPIHIRFALDEKPVRYKKLPFINKKTGLIQEPAYEYTTKDYDWREILYQMALDYYRHNEENDFLIKVERLNPQYINGKTGYEQYYSDIQAFWRQLYNPNPTTTDIDLYGEYYDSRGSDGKGTNKYWNKKIHTSPSTLNFWLDFLDTAGEIGNYSVKKIGTRSKVVNENSVTSIYYKDIPEILFILNAEERAIFYPSAHVKMNINENNKSLFTRSSQGVSAIDKTNELLYQHTSKIGNITLTSIPIYYLQPNTRIYVEDFGDFNIDKISFSLNYNGTMQLTGTKINKQYI